MDRIRVVVADDHWTARAATRSLLERTEDIDVVGEAGDGEEAIELVERLRPDVLVLDMDMPKVSGVGVVQRLASSCTAVKVLAHSGYDDEYYIYETLRDGAAGYLLKNDSPDKFLEAVRDAAKGKRGLLSQPVQEKVGRLISRKNGFSGADAPKEALTRRELEVLSLVAQAKRNNQIAAELFISEGTVRNHINSINYKLGVGRRLDVIAWARRHGIGRTSSAGG